MHGHNLPHEGLELAQDVGNVEDGKEPIIPVPFEVQVGAHACDLGISNVGSVKKRE